MIHSTSRPGLAVFAPLLLAGALGCAAAEDDSIPPTTTTSGVGGDNSAASSSVTSASAGGMGGAGQGGQGGADFGLCDQDCSQFDPPTCFKSVCNEGLYPGPIGDCVVVEEDDGVVCDDGLFCTVNDACMDGECVGADSNDCGLDAAACQEIVCDEDDQECTEQPVMNGESCSGDNLCITGAVCTNGICGGGNVEDCFLQPVPNDCYVSVCNPMNGMCEPIIGNDGQTCTDLNDLCTVDKICNNGACIGGNPKDCSGAAQECEVGVCDMATGNCMGAPGMAGDACTQAADECNAGTCDMNGMCQPVPLSSGTSCPSAVDECNVGECDGSGTCGAVPVPGQSCSSAIDQCNSAATCDASGNCQGVPVADGTACNDGQACTNSDACLAGVCTGSTTATCSQTSDGCCPAACNATNDIDCACGLDKLELEELHLGSDYIVIHNPTGCSLDLAGIEIFFDDSSNTDLTTNLTTFNLAAGASVVITEDSTPPAGQIYSGGNITFSNLRGGAVYLCDGPCNVAANVVDLIAWEGGDPPPPLLSGVTFTPNPATGITTESTQSFLRAASNGVAPNFLQADWTVGPKTQP